MKVLKQIADLVRSNPVELSGGVFFALIAGIIVLNATSLQPGSHPAPLFGGESATTQNPFREKGMNHPLAVDVWEALKSAGYLDEDEQLDEIRISSVIREFQSENNLQVTGKPSEDLLARIMMGNFRVSLDDDLIAEKVESISVMAELATNTAAAPTRNGVNSGVMQVQQALANLGYGPLAVDGIMGNATSSAIQEFELDSGMPITGEPSDVLFEKLRFVGALPIQ